MSIDLFCGSPGSDTENKITEFAASAASNYSLSPVQADTFARAVYAVVPKGFDSISVPKLLAFFGTCDFLFAEYGGDITVIEMIQNKLKEICEEEKEDI